jgi:hypothetical protein
VYSAAGQEKEQKKYKVNKPSNQQIHFIDPKCAQKKSKSHIESVSGFFQFSAHDAGLPVNHRRNGVGHEELGALLGVAHF